jgi:hypothetical protein
MNTWQLLLPRSQIICPFGFLKYIISIVMYIDIYISMCMTKGTYAEKSKRQVIWDGESIYLRMEGVYIAGLVLYLPLKWTDTVALVCHGSIHNLWNSSNLKPYNFLPRAFIYLPSVITISRLCTTYTIPSISRWQKSNFKTCRRYETYF